MVLYFGLLVLLSFNPYSDDILIMVDCIFEYSSCVSSDNFLIEEYGTMKTEGKGDGNDSLFLHRRIRRRVSGIMIGTRSLQFREVVQHRLYVLPVGRYCKQCCGDVYYLFLAYILLQTPISSV